MIAGPERGRSEPVRSYVAPTRREANTYIACSPASQRLLCEVTRARVDTLARPRPLLIGGETGTGKTLLARTIHSEAASGAHRATLHVVNCAALHDALLDEALAPLAEPALEDACETVLLDEVGELSPRGQAMLAERIAMRLSHATSAHFIAASQRDLDAMAAAGTFHAGLFEILGGSRVFLAPLRKRRDEIVPLALHFLRRALATAQRDSVQVAPELLACVERYAWPGNARELQNAMLGALALNDSGVLGVDDMPETVRRADERSGPHPALLLVREPRIVHAYVANDEA